MKTGAFTFFLPLYLLFSNSGNFNSFQHLYRDKPRAVVLNSDAQLNSNIFTTKFYHDYLSGAFIDNTLKDGMASKLLDKNRAGLDWNTEIYYVNGNDSLFGRQGWGYYLGLKNRMLLDAGFTNDAFNLGFYGNAPFAGNVMELSGTNARLWSYQQLQVGFFKSVFKNDFVHVFGFAASYVNGNLNYDLSAKNSTLYTDPSGEFIEIAGKYTFHQTDTQHTSFFFPNGSGAAADLFYELHFPKGHTLAFAVNDIGFVSWNDRSQAHSIDSIFRFEGVYVEDLFNTKDSFFEDYLDSLRQQYILESSSVRYTTPLPMQFRVTYSHRLIPEKLDIQVGAQARLFSNYFPYFYTKAIYYPTKWLMLGGTIGYGGYGSFNVGLDLGFNFGKGYILNLSTRNVEGIVPNDFATGLSAGFRFSKLF